MLRLEQAVIEFLREADEPSIRVFLHKFLFKVSVPNLGYHKAEVMLALGEELTAGERHELALYLEEQHRIYEAESLAVNARGVTQMVGHGWWD